MKEQDTLRRFVFENLGVRGEWVRLNTSWQAAKQHQSGNHVVQQLLGEALAAVVLLSATIKFKGSMILQAQGKGDLTTLVAQSTHNREIRGLVKGKADVNPGSMQDLFGEGYVVLTVKSEGAEPYQGIVPLIGNSIADALDHYFLQSEQLPTRLWLFVDEDQVAGLLLQQLPNQANFEDDWQHIALLANTISAKEILSLSCEDMLYRLFNEDEVNLFGPEAVNFACSCSIKKIEETLFSLGAVELRDIIAQQGKIGVDCEFCGRHYDFDQVDVERILLAGALANPMPDTRH